MAAMKFVPYANESDSIAIDNLTVENHIDRVALFGDVTLTRDKKGLQLALSLQALVNATVQALQRDPLPDVIANVAPQRKPNPF
jgi:hypothetical protein